MASYILDFNPSNLYNNPEDSDATINLQSGNTIYVHRVILKYGSDMCKVLFNSKMSESVTGKLEFPEYSDEVVEMIIKYLYRVEIYPNRITFDKWIELFELADYLQVAPLLDILDINVPENAPLNDLITFAWKFNRYKLMSAAMRIFGHQYYSVETGTEMESLMDNMVTLTADAYDAFRERWLMNRNNHAILFATDCCYVEYNATEPSDKLMLMTKFIPDIKFETFNARELSHALRSPLIIEMPLIYALLKCLGRALKIIPTHVLNVDARSLKHGHGVISTRDPRADIVSNIDNHDVNEDDLRNALGQL